MNDQLQAALAAILGKTVQGIEAGVSFLSGQLPEVIEQLLMWKFAQSIMLIFLGLLLIIPGILCVRGFTREQVKVPADEETRRHVYYRQQYLPTLFKDCDGDPSGASIPLGVGALFAAIFGVGSVIANIGIAVQIWLAPKVYLIEYAASLAKGS